MEAMVDIKVIKAKAATIPVIKVTITDISIKPIPDGSKLQQRSWPSPSRHRPH